MSKQITFYTSKISPFTFRVEIALQEAGIDATRYEIDYFGGNKPAWYTEKINPLGKVPAITYGPPHPAEEPAPDSVKLNESLIIVEFIADLYPHTTLLPKDPVQKARARVFASLMDSDIFPPLRECLLLGTKDISELYKALDLVQSQLQDGVQYAVGNEFTIADIAAASIFCILELLLKNDIGKYKEGEGIKAFEVYNSAKYGKLRGYVRRVLERPSVKTAVDLDYLKETFSKRLI